MKFIEFNGELINLNHIARIYREVPNSIFPQWAVVIQTIDGKETRCSFDDSDSMRTAWSNLIDELPILGMN